jgi:hypothetical protein
MGPETIFYAGQCQWLVISAEYSARSPFEGCSFLSHRRLRRRRGSTLHPRAINDSHSCRFALRSIAWRS